MQLDITAESLYEARASPHPDNAQRRCEDKTDRGRRLSRSLATGSGFSYRLA